MHERDHAQMENEIMNVTRVIMWLVCDNGVKTGKDWVSVAHFIHLFNTTVPKSYTDGAPMSHFLYGRVGMAVRRANYAFKMSRMHACLQNVQHLYNTFNAPVENLPGLGQQCC